MNIIKLSVEEKIILTEKSNTIKLSFPIHSNNIRAKLNLPKNVELIIPEDNPLFSLNNLIESTNNTFIFETNYFNLTKYNNLSEYGKKNF